MNTDSSSAAIEAPGEPRAAADVRRGERWSFWQARKNDLLYQGIRLTLVLVDRLPQRFLLSFGRWLGYVWYRSDARARARALQRAHDCAGLTDPDRIVRQSFVRAGENLGWCLLLRRPDWQVADVVSVCPESRRTLCEAVAKGQRAVVVSAHLGPFELLAARVAELGLKPAVVVRESYDTRLNPLVDHHRVERGVQVIHRGKTTALTEITRALQRQQPVGFLIDLESRVRSISLPFLGKMASIPLGPQRLCQRTRAELLVATLQRVRDAPTPPHFDLKVIPIRAAQDEDEDVVSLTRRVIDVLEQEILSSAEDWLWMA